MSLARNGCKNRDHEAAVLFGAKIRVLHYRENHFMNDTPAASEQVRIGLLVIGRNRPGFDPLWGREVQAAAGQALRRLPWPCFEPSAPAVDDASLRQAVAELRQAGCEGLLVIQPTMGDGRLAPGLIQLWAAPLVLWATTERQDTNRVSACTLVGTHAFASLLRQWHHPYEVVSGHPDDPATLPMLNLALRLTLTNSRLQRAKVGLVGTHAPGFLNMHVDPAMIRQQLGASVHHVGIQEFIDAVRAVDDEAILDDRRAIDAMGLRCQDDIPNAALDMTSRYTLAIRRMVRQQHLEALAVRCWPELPNVLGVWPYFAFARLADEGLAIAMEGDADGALTLLLGRLMGYGAGYLSDSLEYDAHSLTLWHQGEAPLRLCDRSTVALGRHFNNDKPVVVNAQLAAERNMTLARLWHCDGYYRMTAVNIRTAAPRRELKGTRGLAIFDQQDVSDWFDHLCHEGMPHHLALFENHNAAELRRLARQLGITWIKS